MLTTTLAHLQCPNCAGKLCFHQTPKFDSPLAEVRSGTLLCKKCHSKFLILAGIPLLVEDTGNYLITHAKGISKIVKDSDIPAEFRDDFLEVKAQLKAEHIEEDLEAERVNALYLINHYLRADSKPEWWKPPTGNGSPIINSLMREHWDHGPFVQIKKWVSLLSGSKRFKTALELGCGVGGLYSVLKPHCDFYLGADFSFASIALARHLALGVPYPGHLRIPEDLIQGKSATEIRIPTPKSFDGRTDFVVMDFQSPAVAPGWDLVLSLNMIDMLDRPEDLPKLQYELLVENGIAIHSCPYVWHESVTKRLRKILPADTHRDSARAVEWLYKKVGFEIEKSVDHHPWLFYKHYRQIEIYSAHLFAAKKPSKE